MQVENANASNARPSKSIFVYLITIHAAASEAKGKRQRRLGRWGWKRFN